MSRRTTRSNSPLLVGKCAGETIESSLVTPWMVDCMSTSALPKHQVGGVESKVDRAMDLTRDARIWKAIGRKRACEPAQREPLAFFLTWPTYGTWLPGDERGWVEYRQGWKLPDPIRQRNAESRMTEDCCLLDHDQRRVVEATIADHCRLRGWTLHAVNCRSNHVHVVVSGNLSPQKIRDQLKAWCTRRLKSRELERRTTAADSAVPEPIREKWWAERGSALFINDQEGLEAVIHYVREAQDQAQAT